MDFPGSYPGGEESPGGIGENRDRNRESGHLCEEWFSSLGRRMVAKTEDRPRLLLDCLALLDFVSWSVNPQVVGSSPTRGAKRNDSFRKKVVVFFCSLLSSLFTLLFSLKKLSFQRRDMSEERKENVSPSGMILKLIYGERYVKLQFSKRSIIAHLSSPG